MFPSPSRARPADAELGVRRRCALCRMPSEKSRVYLVSSSGVFGTKKKTTLPVSKFQLKPDDTPLKQKLHFLSALQSSVFHWSLCFNVKLTPNSPAPSPHRRSSALSTQLLRTTKKIIIKNTVTSILYTSLIITSEGPDAKVLFHFVWM